MAVPITGFYTGITIIIAIVLGFRIGVLRARKGISILHGDNMNVALRMRQHQNLMETAALTLLAMGIIELGGASAFLLHCLGISFLIARVLHPIGLKVDDVTHPLRTIGAAGSTLVMLVAGGVAIWQFVQGL